MQKIVNYLCRCGNFSSIYFQALTYEVQSLEYQWVHIMFALNIPQELSQIIKVGFHVFNAVNEGVQRISKLMRDCDIHESLEFLLDLSFIVKHFVRYVNNLNQFIRVSILSVFELLYLVYFDMSISKLSSFMIILQLLIEI